MPVPGVPLPPGNERPFCCRAAQLRHIRATLVDVARGQLSPVRALRLEYRVDRYVRYLIHAR